ncbi:MAG TPA: carboxypeptidase-like regulatory domain-containing protein [Pyrinomonadaceae bacterium]|nr:carboxypeptidase-like regulatory domain-containing protein [Pyrinomonadaceae bacterium]
MKRFNLIRELSLICGLLVLLSVTAVGQTGTSSVRGTIVDPNGQVVSGAAVTLTNTETNTKRTQQTSESGIYVFELVTPGPYRVDVEATGFKKKIVTDIQALVAKPTEVNVQLEIGAVTESVTVAATANEVLLNTQDASLGNNFVTKQIGELPLEARNVAALLTLQPGVTREGSVTGSRADQANVTLDGVDINEQQSNQIGSTSSSDAASLSPSTSTVLRLNAEAIDEFRVVTANPNAQFGRSSGAQVSLITKGGTNEYHGALFWFHRPTVLAANDFFNNRAGSYGPNDPQVTFGQARVGEEKVPRPALIRNSFGGAFGGPIVRDRTFFFYSYEGRTDRSQQSVLQRVPLPTLGQGQLRFANAGGGVTTFTSANFATQFAALGGVNPAAVQALAAAANKYRANDFGTTGDSFFDDNGNLVLLNTAGYRFNAYLPSDFNSHVARLDHNLTSKQQIFARFSVNHDTIAGVPAFPDTPRPDTWSHPWGIAAGHTWTISNRFVNNFRYGLTREAFTQEGDASKNEIFFRFVFFPVLDSRTLKRVTPVHNFTDDFSWVLDNHTLQMGGNFRIVRNKRTSFAGAFDTAYTNPSGYVAGSLVSNPIRNFFSGSNAALSNQTSVIQNAASALLGRLTSWNARLTYDKEGNLQPAGTPTEREFATEEYEWYGQDIWKIGTTLTLTYGLRYSLSRPIYETNGYETKPNIALTDYFQRRIDASARGENYFEPLLMDLSGSANGRSSMYPWDKNNFQPRVGIAWSPNFKSGFMHSILGDTGKSVIRGGFAMTNDFLGQQLATRFDQLNSLGFLTTLNSPFSFCNTTTNPCPLFTGYNQPVRTFPLVSPVVEDQLSFPRERPGDMALVIETGLDERIKSPTNYMWNLTFERELPKGLVIQASYIGRLGRGLLISRDVMMPNNLTDPKSGQDWYTAAGILEDYRRTLALQGIDASSPNAVILQAFNNLPVIPFFENMFGSVPNFATNIVGGTRRNNFNINNATKTVFGDAFFFFGNDWTSVQSDLDINALIGEELPPMFFQPQYGALSSFSTVGNSEYHGGTLSIRQRLGDDLSLDFNYTLSKSMDDASGLQNSGSYGGAFILNPLRQRDSWAVSDFDVRHIINFNSLWQLPMGRGRWLSLGDNKVANAVLGNWQLSSIMRWNSGYPIGAPYDAAQWATNWNVQSYGTRVRPIEACPTRGDTQPPRLFGCNPDEAYQSFRNAKPGETGDRNVFRLPGYFNLDMGLSKSFTIKEGQNLQLRFEVFNVTNTQRMGTVLSTRDGYGLVDIPQASEAPTNFSNFTAIQGNRRVMQFGFRYSF